LVTALLPADLLVLLTTSDGLVRNFGKTNAKLISTVRKIDMATKKLARGTESAASIGGMVTKLEAAEIVVRAGIPMVIANGRVRGIVSNILAGKNVGTFFLPRADRLKGRKRWIAFFHHPKGVLVVDDGAKTALRERGKSLLAPGIVECTGEFVAGDVVKVCDCNGTEFARGISKFTFDAIKNGTAKKVIVHRDNLVVL